MTSKQDPVLFCEGSEQFDSADPHCGWRHAGTESVVRARISWRTRGGRAELSFSAQAEGIQSSRN